MRLVVTGLPRDVLTPESARSLVEHLPGVVPEALSESDARRLVARIRAAGGEAHFDPRG